MNCTIRSFIIFASALFCLIGQESVFAQTNPPEIETPGKKDTVFIVRRDTVVVIQRDSVTILNQTNNEEEQISEAEYRRRQRVGGYEVDPRQNDVLQRRAELREQRRREYEEWYAAQPVVRSGNTIGYKFYPSALGQIDFPSIKFAVEKTYNASLGLQASFGFLTTPLQVWSGGGNQTIGSPRFGIRGFNVGAGGRYYFGNVKNRFPFYMELEADYSLAPINIDFWVTSSDGTFEQNIAAPVNAQQFYFGFLTGWELRTKEGFLTDLATGLRLGTKSIRSSNQQIQQSINNRFWNLNGNGSTPYLSVVMRVGLGYGHWIQPESKRSSPSKKKKSSRKKKSSKRRRR